MSLKTRLRYACLGLALILPLSAPGVSLLHGQEQPPDGPALPPASGSPATPESPATPGGPATPGSPSAPDDAQVYQQKLIEGQAREAEQDWRAALESYALSARALGDLQEDDPRSKALRERIEFCSLRYGAELRYESRDFTDSADKLGRKTVEDLTRDVLQRIHHFYVEEVQTATLVQGGLEALRLALSLKKIQARYAPGATSSAARESFYQKLDALAAEVQREGAKVDAERALEYLRGLLDHNAETVKLPEGVVGLELIGGMVDKLDKFSTFMNDLQSKRFFERFSGNYAGIGAYVGERGWTKTLTILTPFPHQPAWDAGLRSGDQVISIEGESTWGKTVDDLVRVLKGAPGSAVKIQVMRWGWDAPRDFSVTRGQIQIPEVHSRVLPGGIGYVQFAQFNRTAPEELEQALKEMEKEGLRALVLDLRDNPGGYLDVAVTVTDKFLEKDKLIVYSEGRNQLIAKKKEFRATATVTHPKLPMVALVNSASASASEIVAGSLQDHQRAHIIGQATFGKGSVQQLMDMTALEGAVLRLTIAAYYLPSGRSIHGKGVVPDIEVAPWRQTIQHVRLGDTEKLQAYVTLFEPVHQELFAELAQGDGRDPARYPHFDELYQGLDTPLASVETSTGGSDSAQGRNKPRLTKDEVRRLLRRELRLRLEDRLGERLVADYQDDPQLEAAIEDLFKTLGEDRHKITMYDVFDRRFETRPVEETR